MGMPRDNVKLIKINTFTMAEISLLATPGTAKMLQNKNVADGSVQQ
jgi:hypothetical protein